MITNFEHITHELTEYELELVRPISRGLITKVGKKNAIKNKDMIAAMIGYGHKLTAARIRKIIHFIRVNCIVPKLIGTSKGYYVADTDAELQTYIKSLDERINSIAEVRAAMSKQL